ncbi:MAG: dihydropteroate synthase [Planctomycetota bacterium]
MTDLALLELERRHAPRLLDDSLRLGERHAPAFETELRCIGVEPDAVPDAVAATRALAIRLDQVPATIATRLALREPGLLPEGHSVRAWTAPTGDDLHTLVLAGNEPDLRHLADLLPAADSAADGVARMIALMLSRRAAHTFTLTCPGGQQLIADECRPLIMGVVNVTPDSFSDGGQFLDEDAAVAHGMQLVEEGADLLDIGGESTRPGAAEVSAEDECARVLPVIQRLASDSGVPISIDSTKSEVVRAALDAGATIINDVSGFAPDRSDRPGGGLAALAAAFGTPCILMHMQGTPRTMQSDPQYQDLMAELCAFFRERTAGLVRMGVPREQIVLDPGFGFGKAQAHNLEMLRRFREFASLGQPLMAGMSRKSMLGRIGGGDVTDRVPESLAVHLIASLAGAQLLRVHDVREMRKVVAVRNALAG